MLPENFSQSIIRCQKCPRLRDHCQEIARVKRRAYLNDTYWGKPITGFGDASARFMIVGLAPAAHGANRTGRIFTGDRSGEWLYRALHVAGFANSPQSIGPGKDELKLTNAFITCVVKCAPPDNKPLPAETKNCAFYFNREITAFCASPGAKVILALGQFAFKETLTQLKTLRIRAPAGFKFKHGADFTVDDLTVLCSFHPSQQNTFTGKLTQPMFQSVFDRARTILGKA